MRLSAFIISAVLAATSSGHANHKEEELAARREFLATHTNSLDHCTSKHQASGLEMRAIKRREAMVDALLAKRGLQSMGEATLL
jgi:hypothetical protein